MVWLDWVVRRLLGTANFVLEAIFVLAGVDGR
jgi:hypothetical protein